MLEIKRFFIGDSCISWSIGNEISEEYSNKILSVYNRIKASYNTNELNILDIVPAYNSLSVHFIPGEDTKKAVNIINKTFYSKDIDVNKINPKTFLLPTIYDGIDIKGVARINRISIKKLIELHSNKTYRVAMIGFRPNFPYLLGLDKQLETKRLDKPRVSVQRGSVAIGGKQTGIYPEESPGGWNIIGRTNPDILKDIKPGDKIIFTPTESLDED